MSGGRDSCVLLDLCASIRHRNPQIELRAIHVDHGLQTEAGEWALHCQFLCNAYEIPLTIRKVCAQSKIGESPEEAARNARYQAFMSLLDHGDVLLMAHHQDDQAETILLQLLRGAGLEGISGMPETAPLGQGTLLRPLLDVGSHQILGYAVENRLHWIEDPSNQDLRFDRNYLRQTIIPLIQARWPAASKVLSRTARHAAEAADHQRKEQKRWAAKIAPQGHFVLGEAQELNPLELRLAVRGWFDLLGLRMPSERLTQRIIDELFEAGSDRTPLITLTDGSQLVRYRGVAYRIPYFEEALPCAWADYREPLALPGNNGTLSFAPPSGPPGNQDPWLNSIIEIRYRSGGERIQLAKRQGHHALRDLFQESGVPPWVRRRIPLIYLDGKLTWVGGFWLNIEVLTMADGPTRPRPVWTPPGGLDPSGSLDRLQDLPR